MTAYARSAFQSEIGEFVVELQSVNRKFLDIIVNVPKELSCFEINLKKWLLPHVARGQVTLKVFVSYENTSPIIVNPNIPLARQIKQAWDKIGEELNLEQKFDLALLSRVEGILLFEENLEEEERYLNALKAALDLSLEKFVNMKLQEGSVLQKDIEERLSLIKFYMEKIKERVPNSVMKYREKLTTRIHDLLSNNEENEHRIMQEVALFADKVDVTEEITRFYCHLSHLEELIHSDQTGIGKTLEFVLQELNREINTTGSKSADLEISRCVIDIKSELERIKEQIQNVE